jgi:hypothetical protein
MNVGLILVFVLGAALLLWLGWISVQSLIQASLLRSIPDASLSSMQPQSGAVRGRIRVDVPIRAGSSGIGNCLWRRVRIQQCGSDRIWLFRGRNSDSWRTVADDTEMAGFVLQVGDATVFVDEFPTEIQGRQSRTNHGDSSFFDQWFGGLRDREIVEWLPAIGSLTVLGRLERKDGAWRVSRDPVVGLLFTPREPSTASLVELLKGIAGLVIVLAGAIGLILLFRRVL